MRFRQLDVLRLFFALVVVAGHSTGWSTFVQNGGMAVDFFFVLSGFVLAHLIINKAPSFATFTRMRFARLWPLHVCTMIATVLIIPKFHARDLWANLLLVQDLVIQGRLTLNGPSWSISAEMIVGVLVLYSLVRNRAIVLAVALVCLCASIEMQANGRVDHLHSQQFGMLTMGIVRCVLGSTLGYLTYELHCRTRDIKIPPATVDALQLISFGAFVFLMATPLANAWRLAMIVLAVAIVFAFSRPGKFVSRCLDNSKMAKLGALSFAVYLVHMPILFFFINKGYLPAPKVIHQSGPGVYALPLAAFFGTVAVVAYLARTFVEVPCNAFLNRALDYVQWRAAFASIMPFGSINRAARLSNRGWSIPLCLPNKSSLSWPL